MENTLIPMTDFVLEQSKKYFDGHISLDQYQKITNDYANFLKQPLALCMFVPCDDDGNVIKDPCTHNRQCVDFCQGSCSHEYYEAQQRVLFEGFSVDKSRDNDDEYDVYWVANIFCKDYSPWSIRNGFKNIEDLVIGSYHPFRPNPRYSLSETALKQIHG